MIAHKHKQRVLVFGTFDILHPGHLWLFQQAKKHGDELIVVITRDSRAQKEKKKPAFKEKERLALVQSIALVDKAVLGDAGGKWEVLSQLQPDVICLGYDQNITHPAVQKQLNTLVKKPKIVKLKAHHPKRFTSNGIRKKLAL